LQEIFDAFINDMNTNPEKHIFKVRFFIGHWEKHWLKYNNDTHTYAFVYNNDITGLDSGGYDPG